MTKQEIEKAVEEYAKSLKSIAFENLSGEEIPYVLRGAFKEGLESANKHWQEKARWIPVEELGLPMGRQLFVKLEDSNYGVALINPNYGVVNSYFTFDMPKITHWKEIE